MQTIPKIESIEMGFSAMLIITRIQKYKNLENDLEATHTTHFQTSRRITGVVKKGNNSGFPCMFIMKTLPPQTVLVSHCEDHLLDSLIALNDYALFSYLHKSRECQSRGILRTFTD